MLVVIPVVMIAIVVTVIIMAGLVLVAVSMIAVPVIVHGAVRSMEDAVLDCVPLAWFAAANVAASPSFAGTSPVRPLAAVPATGSVTAAAVMVVLGKGGTHYVAH